MGLGTAEDVRPDLRQASNGVHNSYFAHGFGSSVRGVKRIVGFRGGSLNIGLGFAPKIRAILQRAIELNLSFLALQEVGDPAVDASVIRSCGFDFVIAPAQRAGVMLLFRREMAPWFRKPLASACGRLVGAVFDVQGSQLVVISAYMPSGLDYASEHSESAVNARKLYDSILHWCDSADQAVVLGDLNETISDLDRLHNPPGVRHFRFISSLIDSAFVDAFRELHSTPGFTSRTVVDVQNDYLAESRIDYVLARGFGEAPVRAAAVDETLKVSRSTAWYGLIWDRATPTSRPFVVLFPSSSTCATQSPISFKRLLTNSPHSSRIDLAISICLTMAMQSSWIACRIL